MINKHGNTCQYGSGQAYRGGVQRRWTEGCEGGDLIQDAGSVRPDYIVGVNFKRGNGSNTQNKTVGGERMGEVLSQNEMRQFAEKLLAAVNWM